MATKLLATSAITIIAAGLAYAVYFDYKRRHDNDFRKSLERERRRHKKAQKAAEVAESEHQKVAIKDAVRRAQDEGFPSSVEEREAYFMSEVAKGEGLLGDNEQALEAAVCFYKALKVYPQPRDLIGIYEKTVPKNVLDVLAVAIAYDDSIDSIMSEAVE